MAARFLKGHPKINYKSTTHVLFYFSRSYKMVSIFLCFLLKVMPSPDLIDMWE